MNRALRPGDRVEFRSSEAADNFCHSQTYPELDECTGGAQTWDEGPQERVMTVVARRTHEDRPVLEVELSWTKRRAFVWAGHLRLDNRARRNRVSQKIEAMKERRRSQRRVRQKSKPTTQGEPDGEAQETEGREATEG